MDYFISLVVIGFSIGMVYALVALGVSLIYSGLDIVHFAHGEIYMLGAFIGLTIFDRLGFSYLASLLVAALVVGCIGALIERLFYRPLTRRGGGISVSGMGIIIAGFGMSIVLQNVAFLIWGPKALPFRVSFGAPLEFGELTLPMSYVWIVCTALALMLLINFVLKRTMIGLAIRAVAHNKDIAYLSGINVPLMMSLIFAAACALGAIAGVLIGPINYVVVLMGSAILMKAFAAAVVGGFGSLPGAIVGGVTVGIIESLGAGYISGTFKDVYAFVVLIIVLMVRPSGLFGVQARMKA